MNKKLLPAAGIVGVAFILLVVNELTETTFVADYAWAFIIVGVLAGVGLTRLLSKSKGDK